MYGKWIDNILLGESLTEHNICMIYKIYRLMIKFEKYFVIFIK